MINSEQKQWTGSVKPEDHGKIQVILEQLCIAFNTSPFFSHTNMQIRIDGETVIGHIDMQPYLIGNVKYQILHGGVAATILDSIGGAVAMAELYKRSQPEEFMETSKRVSKLVTLDMRVDYIAPGRGQYFVARAEVVRLGRKSCLMRMSLHNDTDVLIATGIASYSY